MKKDLNTKLPLYNRNVRDRIIRPWNWFTKRIYYFVYIEYIHYSLNILFFRFLRKIYENTFRKRTVLDFIDLYKQLKIINLLSNYLHYFDKMMIFYNTKDKFQNHSSYTSIHICLYILKQIKNSVYYYELSWLIFTWKLLFFNQLCLTSVILASYQYAIKGIIVLSFICLLLFKNAISNCYFIIAAHDVKCICMIWKLFVPTCYSWFN